MTNEESKTKNADLKFALFAFCILNCSLGVSETVLAAAKLSGTLTIRDALAMPGRPVRIEARLVHSALFAQTGLGGEQLEFFAGERRIGQAMTGGDGRAFLEWTPRMRGNHAVTVKVAPGQRVESVPASAIVACWERRRPILLVEIGALAEETKSPVVPLPRSPASVGRQEDPEPARDAVAVLKQLSQFFYNVIYLSHGETGPGSSMGDTGDVREWLRRHEFPPGLSLTVKAGKTALEEQLDELKAEGWDNVQAGVGRTVEFAEVLLAHRVKVVILEGANQLDKLPKKAQAVKDWKEVRKKL